jgi:hypothetical protein
MMPICGFKTIFGRCNRVAEEVIGEVRTGSGETDGFGKPWQQTHYLCVKHARKLRKLLGFISPTTANRSAER